MRQWLVYLPIGMLALFMAKSFALGPITPGEPTNFNGTSTVKILRQYINLNDVAMIMADPDDPRVVAKSAPKGSIYLRTGPSGGSVFKKQDDGSSINWIF